MWDGLLSHFRVSRLAAFLVLGNAATMTAWFSSFARENALSFGSQLSADARPGASVHREAPLRVCHIASGDLWAGAEVQVAMLLKALSARADTFACAVVLNEGRLAAEIRTTGIPLKVIPEDRTNFFQIASQTADFLMPWAIDVIHSHRYKENLLAAWVARQCRIPHVVRTQHGIAEPFAGAKRLRHALVQGIDAMVGRLATERLVCVTEDLRKRLAPLVGVSKLVVVHNGIDQTDVFSSLTTQDAKRLLGFPPGTPVIGTAGRLEPIKRLDIFLRASVQILHKQPQTKFLIAGAGSEESRLKELADALGIGETVQFVGRRDDIYNVLRAMDVFVLCSDHEGLPMVLLEAMSLGIPIVSRSVGGIPEIIESGIHGLLVHSDDPSELAAACTHVLTGNDMARMAIAAAHRITTEFSSITNATNMVKLYKSLVGTT
jgi:L-malate glycosyltransferase